MAIERSFQNIPKGSLTESDQQSFLVSMGWSKAQGWEQLLLSKRILIVSEAGGGKTHECRAQQKMLWDAGQPAFFLELATLAQSDVRSMLDDNEEYRFDEWLVSQSDVATFFLDSIDELKLSVGTFEQALKRLRKGITGQHLGRVRIIITTRPIPFDEQLVQSHLPIPPPVEMEVSGEMFAQVAMQGRASKYKSDWDHSTTEWRSVVLMPLSDEQILQFAADKGVDDPHALMADLRRRNAQEFARRPQDLIELCADWRDLKRIRTHRDQVQSNVRIKLKAREDRQEPAEVSVDKAIEGASRLALAMMLTRRFTIRHSAEADIVGEDVAFDPAKVLSGWSSKERKALLERPLFGFASYGRVRFHHRSVMEYLAAERISKLRECGMPLRALKRLLFAEVKGAIIVRPSKRTIAGWLAISDKTIFEMLRDHEPAILLAEGDPESLTLTQRSQALRAYAKRFGMGGWRGLSIPHIQVHRFASCDLAADIKTIWAEGIENPEVRETLLHLIDTGQVVECSDIAFTALQNNKVSHVERLAAVDALASLNDARLKMIAEGISDNSTMWPKKLKEGVVLRLFPKHLSVTQLCRSLACMKETPCSIGDMRWYLTRRLAEAELDAPALEALRDGLSALVSTGLRWQEAWPHIVSDRSDLSRLLAAVCVRGLKNGNVDGWLRSSVLALRLPHTEDGHEEVFAELKRILSALPATQNNLLFWTEDAFVQSLHVICDPWSRLSQIIIRGNVQINRDRDWKWIKAALTDVSRPLAERSMLLQASARLAPCGEELRDHIAGLKALVADQAELLLQIDAFLKPEEKDEELSRWEIESAERNAKREQQKAKDHASWVKFWDEIAKNPGNAFSPERSGSTVWNLWRAMSKAGDESRESGWNRRFIEANFGKETADRLRLTLMDQWRKDCPTLTSERPDDAKNTYRQSWQLGLAAIYAESEDPKWATKLSHEEAKLAARYAPIELNGFPPWIEALVNAHPRAVDEVLGEELHIELTSEVGDNWHSMLLQDISHAHESVITAFMPRLCSWFDGACESVPKEKPGGAAQRLEQVVPILRKYGDIETRERLAVIAQKKLGEEILPLFAYVWLPLLMRLDPAKGVAALEVRVGPIEPSQRSEAVTWIGNLFGRSYDSVDLSNPQFTPSILLKLLRLVYRHVQPSDDVNHDGGYSPDSRDDAQTARSAIVNTILKAQGEEGWAAKLEMAADPSCEHFKDRILALAEEQLAEEVDADAFDDSQAIAFDQSGEAPPATNEAIFSVMKDRLEELNDLLLRDDSPRDTWALITQERFMRREIARELRNSAKGLYTVDQEAVTADEKETDIRLRSTASHHEAVIELKLADGRTAGDLRDTLMNQLVTKYMAAETSRSGCLMFTVSKDREWDHPDGGSTIGFTGLCALLREEAGRIVDQLGGTLRLHVHALDLRPRLPTEKRKTK